MTVHQIALRLGKYIGLTSFDPADGSNVDNPLRPGLVPGNVEDVVACINGAMQEIWDLAPAAMRFRRIGTFLRAPVTVALEITQYSKTVAITGYEPWMERCSILIGGDTVANEIVSETELAREVLGGTAASVSAVVYHDCVTPDADVCEILEPVEIPQTRRLTSAGSRQEFYTFDPALPGGDDYGRIWSKLYGTARFPGQPWAYFVDREEAKLRLRVAPMPDGAYPLAYSARINAPKVTVADVGTPDPGVTLPILHGWDESVLLPMALKRFSAHPSFGTGNPVAPGEIDRQYQIAKRIINNAQPSRAAGKMIPTFR